MRNNRTLVSWCLYDFANSAFATVVVTFVYASYFTEQIAANTVEGTQLWSRGVAVTAVVVAFFSPVLGALADRGGLRRVLLVAATATCIVATAMLYFPLPFAACAEQGIPGQAMRALVWFVVANIAFELATVFYNAFLPEIAPAEKIGRISGFGWGLGYVGGLLCMVLALFGFAPEAPGEPWFGLSRENGQNIRAISLLVAAWYAVFCLPMLIWVKTPPREAPGGRLNARQLAALVPETLRELGTTLGEIRRYRHVAFLLLARLFYNDGLVTIFAFGGIYAMGTFGFSLGEVMAFGLVLNISSGIGAFAFGFLDDRLGGKRTIMVSIAGLSLAAFIGCIAPNKAVFWASALLIGIFVGPNQSASRSLMGRLVPAGKQSEFFGFFALSGKATAFLGPLLFGVFTGLFDSQRAGVAVTLLFFLAGAAILRLVDEAEGIRAARGVDR